MGTATRWKPCTIRLRLCTGGEVVGERTVSDDAYSAGTPEELEAAARAELQEWLTRSPQRAGVYALTVADSDGRVLATVSLAVR